MGLSQVYGFARASGGEVQVDSIVGQGTTITLLLPRSARAPQPSAAPVEMLSALHKQRILLVEDDDTVADTVGGMLAELGYETERAAGGDEALRRLAQKADFSLLLSDMIMPGDISGIDLAVHVKRDWPGLAIMLMTGYSAAAASAAKVGVPLLTKPFTIQDLSVGLVTALDQARASRSNFA